MLVSFKEDLIIYLDFPYPMHHIISDPGKTPRLRSTVHDRTKTGNSNLHIPEAEKILKHENCLILIPVITVEKEQRSTRISLAVSCLGPWLVGAEMETK